jgi:proline iminopeptidase
MHENFLRSRVVLAVTALALVTQLASAQAKRKHASKHKPKVDSTTALSNGPHEVVLNGVRVWYRVAGNAESEFPPVIFLHGGPGYNSHSFSVLEGPRLERSLRMVYFDQRGAGHSERPWNGHYQLDTLVGDIEALRRTLDVPQVVLMGHSFGGLLALEYAARYPEHVTKLILVGAFSDGPMTCKVHRERLASMHLVEYAKVVRDTAWTNAAKRSDCDYEGRALSDAEHEKFNDSGIFPDQALQRKQDSVDAKSGLRNTGEMNRALFAAGLFNARFTKHSRVRMPTLVIAGSHDNAVGVPPQRALAAALPNARFAEYPNAGHFPYLEEPERFRRDVISFLTSANEK